MSLTSWSTSNYLRRTSQVLDSYPLLISGWFYLATVPSGNTTVICGVGVSGSGNNERRLNVQGGSPAVPEAFSRTTSNAAAAATTGASQATWGHAFAEFIATNSRACLFNGSTRGTGGTTRAPSASDSEYGAINMTASGNGWHSTRRLAEISMWDGTGMASGDMDTLAGKLFNGGAGGAGGNPINM